MLCFSFYGRKQIAFENHNQSEIFEYKTIWNGWLFGLFTKTVRWDAAWYKGMRSHPDNADILSLVNVQCHSKPTFAEVARMSLIWYLMEESSRKRTSREEFFLTKQTTEQCSDWATRSTRQACHAIKFVKINDKWEPRELLFITCGEALVYLWRNVCLGGQPYWR